MNVFDIKSVKIGDICACKISVLQPWLSITNTENFNCMLVSKKYETWPSYIWAIVDDDIRSKWKQACTIKSPGSPAGVNGYIYGIEPSFIQKNLGSVVTHQDFLDMLFI